MTKSQNLKFDAIENTDAIVGIDIAKNIHWAGINFKKAIIGMEPTGHYWKSCARYLKKIDWIKVVTVNPYHVKNSKEFDDNCQTKNDKKDCMTIARLIKDARFFEPYLPEGIWAELRNLSNTRAELVGKQNAVKNRLIATMDEYFPEYTKVFKKILSRTSEEILKECPFPEDIKSKGKEELLKHIKKTVKRGYSKKQVETIYELANESIGTTEGTEGAKFQLNMYIEEAKLLEKQIKMTEQELERQLKETGFYESLTSIQGIGIVNKEIKELYKYLTTRKENQLKKKQAIVAVIGKILQIIYAVVTKNEEYKATRVFSQDRLEQLKVA